MFYKTWTNIWPCLILACICTNNIVDYVMSTGFSLNSNIVVSGLDRVFIRYLDSED